MDDSIRDVVQREMSMIAISGLLSYHKYKESSSGLARDLRLIFNP